MKKIIAIILTIAMLLSCTAFAEDATQTILLGTSGLAMTVPAGYEQSEITGADTDENQVAYYASEESAVDFDVYQWAAAVGESLDAVAAAEATEYGAEAVEANINGIIVYVYDAVEESEGQEYATYTCMMQNGDFFAEVVFWLDGDNAAAAAADMISTLEVIGTGLMTDCGDVITLGTTSYTITLPAVYQKGMLSAEDTDDNQVAYYYSADCAVDFDVYQWTKAEGETLADVAAAEAAEYGAEAEALTVNDVTIYGYEAVEHSDDDNADYPTATIIMETETDFVEVVFWLDGDDAAALVAAAINTIVK